MFKLTDKTAIVTGASRGLGREFAKSLAEAGADIIINSRNIKELEEVYEQIRKIGRRVLPIEADITDVSNVKNMIRKAIKTFNHIDILINNAATGRINRPIDETESEEWDFVINTNITGVFNCSREVLKVMKKQKKGKIVNISSISGMIINKYFHGGSYDVSKAGIVALTKAMATEYARYNINVNAVAPGYYKTKPNEKWFQERPEIYEKILDMIPLRRLGNIKELGALIVFLSSDASNYMTGSLVVIDGGYTIW